MRASYRKLAWRRGTQCLRNLLVAGAAASFVATALFVNSRACPDTPAGHNQRRGTPLLAPPNDTRHASVLSAGAAGTVRPDSLKILLFITTNLSGLHIKMLRYCWRSIIGNSSLIQQSDVLVAGTLDGAVSLSDAQELFSTIFADSSNKVRVVNLGNPGYQEGAMLPYQEAVKNKWFSGYDWVVRLNPDVLILDDTWILKTLLDKDVDGIFVDCLGSAYQSNSVGIIHSDFTIFRPTALPPDAFRTQSSSAEAQSTENLKFIASKGRHRLLKGGGPDQPGICRVGGDSWPGSPVLHTHNYRKFCQGRYDPSTFVNYTGGNNED